MPQQQCYYDSQRKARNLRRGLYRQEICRPMGFPVVQRKTTCCAPRVPTLVYPKCGPSYRRTPPDFLHHHDFKPTCPKPLPPPCPPMCPAPLPQPPCPPIPMCCETICGPPMPVLCRDAVRAFPPATAAETIVSGFRQAHSEPGLDYTSQGLQSTYQSPCDYMNNFQIVHTMVNTCSPCAPQCSPPLCAPAFCPSPCPPPRLPLLSCCPGTGYMPDEVVIKELADDECQRMGLCGYERVPPCYQMALASVPSQRRIYTSLPGLEDELRPKPWRDPCGGRIYFRLNNNDLTQQW